MGLGGGVHVAQGGPGLDPDGPPVGIHGLQAGEIHDEAVVAERAPGDVVAGSLHGQREVVAAGEGDGRHHVVGTRAAGDDGGVALDHAVPERSGFLVVGRPGREHGSVEVGGEGLERGGVEGRVGGAIHIHLRLWGSCIVAGKATAR